MKKVTYWCAHKKVTTFWLLGSPTVAPLNMILFHSTYHHLALCPPQTLFLQARSAIVGINSNFTCIAVRKIALNHKCDRNSPPGIYQSTILFDVAEDRPLVLNFCITVCS